MISLAADPARPSTLYAGTIMRGIARSRDGGAHWRRTGPFPLLADGAVPRAADVMSLAVDPAAGAVYAGTNFGGVLRSRDGGRTWRTANRGLTSPAYFTARVFYPIVSLLLGPGRTLYAAMAGEGVFVSRDRASHWQRFGRHLPQARVESLALVGRRLYAATASGVFVSTGGAWRTAGLRGEWLETIAADAHGTLYAGALKRGVFTSRDGGRRWRRSNAGLGNLYVRMLLADPLRRGRVYAGTYGGVYVTRDSGTTWSALNTGLRNRLAQALAIGRSSERSLYVGTLGSGVFAIEAR